MVQSNATVCVILLGATSSPNVASALSVDASVASTVHLEVRGIRFGNFTNAIVLSGGAGHWIHGNFFAGPFLFPGTVLGNGVALQIDGGVADVIGGVLPADVNIIGASTGAAAVLISGGSGSATNSFHIISNNSIGGEPASAGSTYANSGTGITLLNNSQSSITSNWIVANGGDGIRIDSSFNALVQSNAIGSSSAGLANGGAGVRVLAGGSSNFIGSPDPRVSGGANTIEGNGNAGVLIDLDAGTANQVSGGGIQNNGGIAVDLAPQGTTVNIGSENSGPNNLIHKPQLGSADVAAVGPTIKVVGKIATLPNTPRYISVYGSHRCGDAFQLLGGFYLNATPGGAIALNLVVAAPTFAPAYITAITHSATSGSQDSSEVSNCKKLSSSDDIFNDGFDDF